MGAMGDFFDLSTVAKRFRFVAVAEAISWAGLLIAMCFKYIPDHGNKTGVQIFGMVHGLVFIAFVLVTVVTARALKWTPALTLLALASSIPPFCTVVVERYAARTDRLAELSVTAPAASEQEHVGS